GGTPSLLGSGHRPDIFRSRPQNTSRPPSLHVDDFNKLEKDDDASERNYGREESARFRLFRDGRPGRAALAPTVSAAGPGGGILPAAAMATFLNWGGKPM
ncbi:unnamed protein product, partial [Dibothriocephalus latus]